MLKRERIGYPSLGVFFACSIVIFIIWGLNLYAGERILGERAGVFGDQFGAANALFSGLSLVGVIYAILVQRYEVSLAKEDLAETKRLLEEQAIHLERQNSSSRKKQFEDTFFRMIEVYERIVENTDVTRGDRISKGKDATRFLFNSIIFNIRRECHRRGVINSQVNRDILDESYRNYMEENGVNTSHYMRVVYNILKFVDGSDVDNKKEYTNVLRAMMSDYEVGILYFNCLTLYGRDKMKPLVEKYAFLKHLPEEFEFREQFRSDYTASAFG